MAQRSHSLDRRNAQYVDWGSLRHLDVRTPTVREEVERFCDKIVEALREPWVSSEEHQKLELEAQRQAEAARQAENEKQRNEAAARPAGEAKQQVEVLRPRLGAAFAENSVADGSNSMSWLAKTLSRPWFVNRYSLSWSME
jgi:hypothetical protein